MSTYGEVDTKEAGARRRRWPEALKRELVAATLEPGASVSVVARRHDLNANQLFKWRRQFGGAPGAAEVDLLPVAIGREPTVSTGYTGPTVEARQTAGKSVPGAIEIALPGGVRVKISGVIDPATVTAALRAVLKARRRR